RRSNCLKNGILCIVRKHSILSWADSISKPTQAVALTVCAVLVFVTPHYGQTAVANPNKTSDVIERVLDLAFPRATTQFQFRDHEFALDVRFQPAFRAPVQVSILKPRDGRVRILRHTLANEAQSLGDQVLKYTENQEIDDSTLLRRL